jgi:hypothetical protein
LTIQNEYQASIFFFSSILFLILLEIGIAFH